MFHEIRFPANLSFGSVGGPERRTEIVTLTNGYEERNTPWAHSRRHYDAGLGLRALDDIEALIAFFEARGGQLHGFRWKDWADFKSSAPSVAPSFRDQVIGIGDGVNRTFALRKAYASGAARYWRPITKPVEGTVLAGIGDVELRPDVDFEVNLATGIITFAEPPEIGGRVVTGFEFDVPVRFDSDTLDVTLDFERLGSITSIPLLEIRR